MTAGALLVLGCGAKTDVGIRFEMEKMLTKADHQREQLMQKNQTISDEDLQKLVDDYSKIAGMIPPPKNTTEAQNGSPDRQQAWNLSSLASTRIGLLYIDHKMYDKAYDCFKSVSENPATSQLQKNAILNYMAVALERAARYQEAAALYDSLAEGYLPLATAENPNMDALGAPIKAAQMWAKNGDQAKYLAGMEKARAYYTQIAGKYKGSLLESGALGKIAASYIEQQMYPQAIDALKMVQPDSSGQLSPSIILMIADIYLNKMGDFKQALKTYQDFERYYPSNENIGSATLGEGLSLYQQGLYPQTRKAVANIDKLPKIDQKTVAEAYYLAGLCYEKENKWDLAQGQFDMIQASFPGTNESFEAALYIPLHYRTAGEKEHAQRTFESAVDYINKFVDHNSADPVACSRALGYLVRAYTENGDMDKATEQLALIHEKYPQYPEGKFAPLRIADISENSLHDTAKAIGWLKTFVKENPDADNLKDIKTHIETLEAHLSSQ
jgi:tetratricopeptide (TPR) repeat protein